MEPGAERVDWAGLPVNLDMVFSQRQRDKVYAQHLMRARAAKKELPQPRATSQPASRHAANPPIRSETSSNPSTRSTLAATIDR